MRSTYKSLRPPVIGGQAKASDAGGSITGVVQEFIVGPEVYQSRSSGDGVFGDITDCVLLERASCAVWEGERRGVRVDRDGEGAEEDETM